MTVHLTLSCDPRPLTEALDRLAASLAEAPEDVLQSLHGLLGLPDAGQQVCAVKVDVDAAAGAGEVIVRLDPSERLRGLLAAAGAWNGD